MFVSALASRAEAGQPAKQSFELAPIYPQSSTRREKIREEKTVQTLGAIQLLWLYIPQGHRSFETKVVYTYA